MNLELVSHLSSVRDVTVLTFPVRVVSPEAVEGADTRPLTPAEVAGSFRCDSQRVAVVSFA